MNKGAFPGANSGPILPFEPPGGHVLAAQATLPVPDFATLVAVTLGSGTIKRLPAWPAYSAHVTLVFKAAITLVNSAYLVLPGGADILTAVDDIALAVPIGDGRWSLKYGLGFDNSGWTPQAGVTITPLSGAFTSVAATGRYRRLSGKTVLASYFIQVLSVGTAAGAYSVNLPIAAGASSVGTITGVVFGSPLKALQGYISGSGGSNGFALYDGTTPGAGTHLIQAQYESI